MSSTSSISADNITQVVVILLRDYYVPWHQIATLATVSRNLKAACYCDQIFQRLNNPLVALNADSFQNGVLTFTGGRELWIQSFTQQYRSLYQQLLQSKQLKDLIRLADAGGNSSIQKTASLTPSMSKLNIQTAETTVNIGDSSGCNNTTQQMKSAADIATKLAVILAIHQMGFPLAQGAENKRQTKFNIYASMNYYRDLLLARLETSLMQRHALGLQSTSDDEDDSEQSRAEDKASGKYGKRRGKAGQLNSNGADNDMKACLTALLILPGSSQWTQQILDSFMIDRLQTTIPRQLVSSEQSSNQTSSTATVTATNSQHLFSVELYRKFWMDLLTVLDSVAGKLQRISPTTTLRFQLTRLLERAVSDVLRPTLTPFLNTGRQQQQLFHLSQLNSSSSSNNNNSSNNNRRNKEQMYQFLDVLALCIQQWTRLVDLVSETSVQYTGAPIGKGSRRKLTMTIFGDLHAEYIELEIQGFCSALSDIPIHPKNIASNNILMELINNENDIMTSIRYYFMDKTKQALANRERPSINATIDPKFAEFTWPKFCLQILGYFQRSLNRSALIGDSDQMPRIASRLYTSLLKEILVKHYQPIFEECFTIITACKVSDEGDEDSRIISLFLEVVYFADLVHQMIDNYIHDCLQELIDMQDSFTEFAREKKSFEKSIDDLVAKGLEACINIVLERVQITMQADHKLTDYNFKLPKPNMEPTEACKAVVTTVEMYSKLVARLVDKSVHQVFITELGTRLFQAILKNMKRFVVSSAGGLQVITDFNHYYSWAARYQMPTSDLRELFATLKQLGNMYIVDADGLRDLIHEQQVARFHEVIKTEELLEMVALRADWQKIKGVVEASECVIS